MITGDDNKDDNGYARVKAWRLKNRSLWNLKQREYRRKKKNLSGGVESRHADVSGFQSSDPSGQLEVTACEDQVQKRKSSSGSSAPPAQSLFQTKKVGEFRILPEEPVERREMPVVKPKVFFNDHGAQISESVYNRLQEKKREASEKGYEFDPQ
jgi:hypothetical protein